VARRGTLRASDADREQVVDRLRRASTEGRLAVHEFEHRVTAALGARTYAQLDATVADLPGNRVGERGRGRHRAVRTVQAHPALLLVAIPLAVLALATLAAVAVVWSVLLLVVFLLSRRRHPYRLHRGPWVYDARHRSAARHRFGPPRGAQGPGGPWS